MTNQKLHRDLPSIANQLRELVKEDGSIPPVETWHPEREADIDICIDVNGKWTYQGEEMSRISVVRLLASILRKDGDDYCLVTPFEKMNIKVEDVPFVVSMMDVENDGSGCREQKIHLSTQLGDTFTLSKEHPLTFRRNERGDDVPYVTVRGDLKARLNRSVYYELADLVVQPEERGEERWGVWSAGEFFAFAET